MISRVFRGFTLPLLALCPPAFAAEQGTEIAAVDADNEIVVTAPITEDRVQPPIIQIDSAEILARAPTSIADALTGLAGVSVKTNSRGETIARVRGAEERQTQVFLDGAPLSVPWDGRIDLGVLPAGLIGNIRVTKGAVPIEFGANSVAGVVDLQSRRGRDGESSATGILEGGTYGLVNASGVASLSGRNADLTLAGGYITRNAEPVADRDEIPFSQPDDDRRTNTDIESFSLFGAAGARFGVIETRASILHNTTERGIAPESDRDPALFAPRYWRYPNIALTQLTLNARADLGGDAFIAATGWRQWFNQRIDAYRDVTYTALRSRQQDEDDTTGGRLTGGVPIGPVTLRGSASYLSSTHDQVDTAFPSGVASPRLKYRQRLMSFGLEGDIDLGEATQLTLGGAYDREESPLTGDKPSQPSQDAWAFSGALRQRLGENFTLTVSGGRRTRFASLRELFGEALGRFLINPDLRPERAWLADVELAYATETLRFAVNPFYNNGDDTIAQRVVRVGGVSLRQRFNLTGTETWGVDAVFVAQLMPGLTFDLSGTYLNAKAEPGDAAFRRLLQRPEYEVTAILDWRGLGDRLNLRGEVRQTGAGVDLDEAGLRLRLPPSTEVNLRAAITVLRTKAGSLQLTGAVDNLTDEFILPQAGLPAPGRTWRVGLRFN